MVLVERLRALQELVRELERRLHDSSLLNQGNLTEVEVIDNNGTAEVVEFASDISNDDHTVQKLENQTDLDDDSSLLNQGNLTEVEVIDNNGTAEVVEFR